VKVVPFMVEGFIASLKVAVTAVLGQAPFAGVSETTVGEPTVPEHVVTPVVKVQTKLLAKLFPKASAAPVVIVAV
jgi:hypothetical protein